MDDIYTLIQIAAKIFKQRYGEYPEYIGLDLARCRQAGLQHYSFVQMAPVSQWQGWDNLEQQTTLSDIAEVVHIEIVPVWVQDDELWCKRGTTTRRMTVWGTSSSYHAIIWQ